ncbi:Protein of Unknown Function (DUF239) [Quillaja saponaria]|uniref:Neprosin PEP catalytic domain-containing protein n=1 Tax=Quillaja saponaria TaxID=32244 RepID=A0AAD7L6C6_QUISA|nr:Protein of Unknown Function (DUF239) [Quillaja saponaria]
MGFRINSDRRHRRQGKFGCGVAPSAAEAVAAVLFAALRDADQWRDKLTKEEDLELNRQLKLINKPATKSFRTEFGDIVDCIEIHKQLTFDHPLLKNHVIQMMPKTIPKGVADEAPTYTSLKFMPKKIWCPEGSVPIKRATKEDLIMGKHLKSLGLNYSASTSRHDFSVDFRGYHYALLEVRMPKYKPLYGARGRINLWNLSVNATQLSVASICIVNGPREESNSIQAGWGVNPTLYPNDSRLYIFWTADGYKTGCYNLLCPGFVQVSTKIVLGSIIKPDSVYNGPQYDLLISFHQDPITGDWWFMFQDEYVGYWPKKIFPSFNKGATYASWGGEVYSPLTEPSPAMGSGHFPEEGYGKCAYVNQIQLFSRHQTFFSPHEDFISIKADKSYCYNALDDENVTWGRYVYFGGPGNCTF